MAPPPLHDTKNSKTSNVSSSFSSSQPRLRKFIARPSAGLRIRIHPTLQSEQIGVVPVEGIVAIVDEIHNTDGIWVRLGLESLAEYSPGNAEGWCLQFNQHLEKTLMIPVAETKPASKSSMPPQPNFNPSTPAIVTRSKPSPAPKKRSRALSPGRLGRRRMERKQAPGSFTVIKCGASGHNIRSQPSLSASPIGRINLGDVVNVVKVKDEGSGEVWVQLDQVRSYYYYYYYTFTVRTVLTIYSIFRIVWKSSALFLMLEKLGLWP